MTKVDVEVVKLILVSDYDVDSGTAEEVLELVEPELYAMGWTADELAEHIYTNSKYWIDNEE